VILLLLIFVLCVSACSNTNGKQLERIEWVECGEIKTNICHLTVCYDTKTKVMYAIRYESGVTVLLNADGTPMLYEGEDK
jgi:hypothetical protein